MFSELKSVSFMGAVSNSQVIFSEKDLNSLEFDFLGRPSLEFEDEYDVAPLEDNFDQELDKKKQELQDREQEKGKEAARECQILVSNLEVRLPSKGEEFRKIQDNNIEDDGDGFKTPTSLDHKIPPVILQCPPAPRKPKSLPSTKRKSPARRTALLDLSNEIESLFPLALVADLGGKIKKARQGNDTK